MGPFYCSAHEQQFDIYTHEPILKVSFCEKKIFPSILWYCERYVSGIQKIMSLVKDFHSTFGKKIAQKFNLLEERYRKKFFPQMSPKKSLFKCVKKIG